MCEAHVGHFGGNPLITVVEDAISLGLNIARAVHVNENEDSEVRFIDNRASRDLEFITSIYKLCILADAGGCTVSRAYAGSQLASSEIGAADIFLNWRKIKGKNADRNRIPPPRTDVLVPADFRFGECVPPSGAHFSRRDRYVFELVVHEAGHALGLSEADIRASAESIIAEAIADTDVDYIVSHPNIAPSVLNYDSKVVGARGEPDCFPHPMDVLAIHALYQTGYGP